jgi:hypothetical protein
MQESRVSALFPQFSYVLDIKTELFDNIRLSLLYNTKDYGKVAAAHVCGLRFPEEACAVIRPREGNLRALSALE